MLPQAVFVLAVVAVAINARSFTSPGSGVLSTCILACVIPAAAKNGCSGHTDLPCVCTNPQFQSDAGTCLQQHCTPANIQGALQLQRQACTAAASSTVTPTPRALPDRPDHDTHCVVNGIPPGNDPCDHAPTTAGTTPSTANTTPSTAGIAPSVAGTPSAAGTNLRAGTSAFFGAILAAVFAL